MAVSMVYGARMRNIRAGAVIAAARLPAESVFSVIIATLFEQVLAALYGVLMKHYVGGN